MEKNLTEQLNEAMTEYFNEGSEKQVYKKARSKLLNIPVITDSSQIMAMIKDGVGEDKELLKHLSAMTDAFNKAFDHLSKKSK